MPHLTLEYSDNLPEPLDHRALFASLHAVLERLGSFSPSQMKSRAVPQALYYTGTGAPDNIFVHLTVAVLNGRDPALWQQISAELLVILQSAFARAWIERPCDLTVEIREMRREWYSKTTNELVSATTAFP